MQTIAPQTSDVEPVPMRRVYEYWQKVRHHRATEELVLELVARQMRCSVQHVVASIAVCSPPLGDPRVMKRRASGF